MLYRIELNKIATLARRSFLVYPLFLAHCEKNRIELTS